VIFERLTTIASIAKKQAALTALSNLLQDIANQKDAALSATAQKCRRFDSCLSEPSLKLPLRDGGFAKALWSSRVDRRPTCYEFSCSSWFEAGLTRRMIRFDDPQRGGDGHSGVNQKIGYEDEVGESG
jgi:hypothetical protein